MLEIAGRASFICWNCHRAGSWGGQQEGRASGQRPTVACMWGGAGPSPRTSEALMAFKGQKYPTGRGRGNGRPWCRCGALVSVCQDRHTATFNPCGSPFGLGFLGAELLFGSLYDKRMEKGKNKEKFIEIHSVGHTYTQTCTQTHRYTHAHTNTHMHIHKHTDIHMHTHKYTHAYTQTQIYTYTHKHSYAYTQTQIYTCTHTNTHMRIHTQIYTCTQTHICIYTNTQIYTYTHKHTYAYTQTHRYTHAHTNTQMRINKHTDIHKHTYTHTHMHIHKHTDIHMHTHKYTYAYTQTHRYTHTHKYTYAYTQIHRYTQTHVETYTVRVCSVTQLCVTVAPWTIVARLLCPWDSSGKNTGVGCHFLLQGIFLTRGWSISIHPYICI